MQRLNSDRVKLMFIGIVTVVMIGSGIVKADFTFGEPANLGPPVNTSFAEIPCYITADGMEMYLQQYKKPGGYGLWDIWVSTKQTSGRMLEDNWSEPQNLGPPINLGPIVNSTELDAVPRISPDGSMLYFCSTRPGNLGGHYCDIYQTPVIPIVDLNSDGIVDAADMRILVDNWGTDEPLCDIGPMPWGDGIVDVQDLIIFAEHLFEEVPPVQ